MLYGFDVCYKLENMVTIYDISKQTGFSPPTVSKALTDTGTISAKTRKQIIAVAREMGYEPNLTARNLRTRRTRLIGILNETLYRRNFFLSPFFSDLLGSFKEFIETEGYDLLLLSDASKMEREFHFLGNRYRQIDGMLILYMKESSEQQFHRFISDNKPCVSVNDTFPGISLVVTGNQEGGRIAVQHLIDLGHRRIAYLAGPITRNALAAEERRQGYRGCLVQNGITPEAALEVASETWFPQGGYEACRELLNRDVPFSALFVASNHLAIGAMRYLHERGRRVPGDVAVIGFDDGDGLDAYITPSLSTMRQDQVRIGRTAAELLLRKLKGETTEDLILIPAELIPRETTIQG